MQAVHKSTVNTLALCTENLRWFALLQLAGAVGALGGAGVRTVADSAVVAQRDQLRSEVDALRSRLESLQTATDAALSSKTVIAQQLSQAQATIVSREAELTRLQDQLLSKAESEAAAGVAKQADQAAAAHRVLEAAESTKVQMTELQQQVKARDAQVMVSQDTEPLSNCKSACSESGGHILQDMAAMCHDMQLAGPSYVSCIPEQSCVCATTCGQNCAVPLPHRRICQALMAVTCTFREALR